MSALGILPYLALRSLVRVVAAYLLSLVFSIAYGYVAATDKRAERVMLPLLDVLQSVPILAFFPAAVLFFVTLFHGSSFGLELASIFLIFTSQAWNLAFGVYEAVKTIPPDLSESAAIFGLAGWRRFRRLLLPAMVPKLVYNSIVSWAGGWYFLTASEIIATNSTTLSLPGLGAFIADASSDGRIGDMFTGIAVLVAIVVAFELALWRPLTNWSRRFIYDVVGGGTAPRPSRVVLFVRSTIARLRAARPRPPPRPGARPTLLDRLPPGARSLRAPTLRGFRVLAGAAFLALALFLLGTLAAAVASAVTRPLPTDVRSIPLALVASTLRLLVAYVIALAWTIPAAIYIARNERAARILMPTAEVLASIPAIALFPLIVLILLGFTHGLDIPSIALVLTGMQWYLLFNLIAGARSVPPELSECAAIFGVKGALYWRRVLIPAMLPSLVTGSITAWGGGWNALIVSEYVQFRGETLHAFGIGDLIDRATFDSPDTTLLLFSVLAMVLYIYLLNRLVWKRLYRRVLTKYKIEGTA